MSDYGNTYIYGKIEEELNTPIIETKDYYVKMNFEIEKEYHESIKDSGLQSYFDKKYKSSKEEFETIKNKCMSFLNKC